MDGLTLKPASNRDVTCQVCLFLIMDWVVRRTIGRKIHIFNKWKFISKLDDLAFVDNAVLISTTKQYRNSRFRIKQQEWITKPEEWD